MTERLWTSRDALCSNFPLLAFAPALLCALTIIAMPSMQAQTMHTLHVFTGGGDGSQPFAGVTLDRDGNLSGTTNDPNSDGGVYELVRQGSDWIFKPLYNFQPQNDGQHPIAPVAFGPDGALYGTTALGGYNHDGTPARCGTVYGLHPSSEPCESAICLLNETRVYWFGGDEPNDGYQPNYGSLLFDSAGNVYGTTFYGGTYDRGTAYELLKTQDGWSENIIYNFRGHGAPVNPQAGLTFDSVGNLYGTGFGGSNGFVYELVHSGQGWDEQTIYSFQGGNDGAYPVGGLIFDANGNAYGTTEGSYTSPPGTVFQLSPQADGTWRETVLHHFDLGANGPVSNLAMDAAGNLYGTTPGSPTQDDRWGMVFRLSPVNGSWVFTQLYEFTNGSDGANPAGGVSIDSSGNLYGACTNGGANGLGTVWEITP
jgi:hypothetical protein